MASITLPNAGVPAISHATHATTERTWMRWTLIGVAVTFLGLFLFLPLAIVFSSALAKGISVYFAALCEPDAIAAIRLTLIAAAISVPAVISWRNSERSRTISA